jgi:hypothetical protein
MILLAVEFMVSIIATGSALNTIATGWTYHTLCR